MAPCALSSSARTGMRGGESKVSQRPVEPLRSEESTAGRAYRGRGGGRQLGQREVNIIFAAVAMCSILILELLLIIRIIECLINKIMRFNTKIWGDEDQKCGCEM